jgi:hypothetical protein
LTEISPIFVTCSFPQNQLLYFFSKKICPFKNFFFTLYLKVLFMQPDNTNESLEALKEIRSIMDRSARFISLSGWSGIWAGCTALVGAYVAYGWIKSPEFKGWAPIDLHGLISQRLYVLAFVVFTVALSGGIFFTYRKASRQGQKLWNNASRQMLLALFFPMFAGGVFCLMFINYGCDFFVAPACLAFYGLALISASRHTLSDIRYLGMLEVVLGCTNLFFLHHGIYFWAIGFGVLHILYGAFMWNKYDK